MTILQIDVQGTDADGNTATGTIEVEVNEPPAVSPGDAVVTPPTVQASASIGGVTLRPAGADEIAAAGHATPEHRASEAPRFGEKQPSPITGLTNGVLNNHQGATVKQPAPKVTQAVRSMTLLQCTGGYR